MKKLTFILAIFLLSFNTMAVDIIGHFNLQSYGKYYPYHANGTINTNFDFEVQNGPINSSFKIGFYLSSDMIITTSDFLINTFTVSSANNGSSAFPDQFGQAAPYQIENLLTIPNIPINTTVFFGVILDSENDISESDESNNSGPINMAPFQIVGHVSINFTVNNRTIDIRPNPIISKAIINVKGTDGKGITLKVMDITGRIVYENKNLSFPFIWDRGDLKNGLYLFIIEKNNKAILRKKVVLQ